VVDLCGYVGVLGAEGDLVLALFELVGADATDDARLPHSRVTYQNHLELPIELLLVLQEIQVAEDLH